MIRPGWIRRGRALAASALVSAVLITVPTAGDAQIPGLPYYTDPFDAPAARNSSVLMTVGHATDVNNEEGLLSWTIAGRYRPTMGVTVTGTAGLHYPDAGGAQGRGARPQLAAAWDWIAVNLADVIVGLHNGVGYRRVSDGGVLTIPLGAGVTWFLPVVPTAAGPQVGVWALPRGEYLRRAGDGVTATDLTWAASFGVSVLTSGGLGINLGGDYRSVPAGPATLPFVPDWSWALMVRRRR